MSLTELPNQKTVSIDLLSAKTAGALETVYSMLDDVPFAVAVLKGEALIVEFINKYNLAIWQRKKEDVIGKPLFDVRPDMKESVAPIHREIYKTGNRFSANEVPVEITNNGEIETRYFNAVIDPIVDEKGNIIGQLATSIEVTEQVLSRKKIEESQQQLQNLFAQAPVSIQVFRGEDFIVEVINEIGLEMWGKTYDEVIGKPFFEIFPELKEVSYEALTRPFKTGVPFEGKEFSAQLIRNGKVHHGYYDFIAKPIKDKNGTITGLFTLGTEVTEKVLARKKIEESEALLRKTKEQLELSIEAGKIGVWLWDVKQKQMTWSKEQLEIFGVDKEDFNGEADDFFKHVIEEDQDKIRKASGLEFERSENQYEFRILRKDGALRWIQSRSKTFMDENGDPQYITGINIDITEEVEAHEKIQKSEEENRLFIEYAPAAMAMFDKDMRYISVSKQWMKEYDLAGNVIGRRHYELFPNILQRWKDVHSRCLHGAVEKSDEDFYIKDDGTHVWLRWEVHPWYNATGEIGGIVIFTENITERKKHQQAIKESENRFRTMANEAPLFVWETDENLQTTYLNKEGLSYFGLEDSFNMAELSWKKFIHPDDIDRVLTEMRDAANLHQSYTLEMRLKHGSTGEYHWFLDKGAPRYVNDKFIGFIGTSLDIHERKEIEKALEEKVKDRTRELAGQNILLKKQNDLVKKIFDSSVDAMGVYDTELRLITLNESSLKLIGRNEKEVIGKKLLDILPQMEGTKGHKDLLSAISGKTIHNKVFYSEITNRYYENFLMPLKDEKDKVYAVLVIAHDNTDLITSAEKLKEAQHIAQIGHWEWDVVSGQLTWSDNMYHMYGLDPKEGIDYDKFISLVHPNDRVMMQANIEHAIQTQSFSDFFHRIITPAGVENIMHARGEVIRDKHGKVIRMVGTGQDVTKQKITEQQLIATSKNIEERNQFIEQLINSSLDLIMVIDKDMRFITMNKKAQLIYKEYYKEDIVGKKVTEVSPPVKGTESYADLQQAFRGNVIIKDKVKSTISDRYYEHNYVPLTNAGGEVYAVMIISHDITERMRQMEELKKLYESDEQKNNFIAMASHELKTPITSIKGYVQLLLNAFEKEKDRQKPLPPLLVRSSLLSVDKQIKRLTRLISELLDISKIETGTLELKKEKFSLNELAIETVEDILYTNTRHEINLYHDHHSYVYGDKDRIGQVMINFLTNAVKYSPESDKIDVTIKKGGDSEIAFSVRDYGIGIDKEEQEKIFERFYRAKGKEEQTYPGFGIGLFIAKEFIQKHGGRIMVESGKGKGAVFTFTLPVNIADT